MFPLPYALLGLLLAVSVAFGTGWHYGGKQVKADWAVEKIKVAAELADAQQRVYEADARADKAASARQTKRQVEKQVVYQEVAGHAQTLPDPVECSLAPERVRAINAAIGEVAAGTGKQAATLPAVEDAGGGQAPASGGMGSSHGVRLPLLH